MLDLKQTVVSNKIIKICVIVLPVAMSCGIQFALASSDLSNLNISKNYESSTKYFYDQKPIVAGSIDADINGVIVYFDNISNSSDYSVTVTQAYPATTFKTQNDCFSYGSQCPNALPDGTYRITVEASKDLYSDPDTYTFPKLLVENSSGAAVDETAPVITLNGSSTVTIVKNGTYTELGATWTDNVDGSGAANVSGAVDTGTVGTYTIYYNYTDQAGNQAAEVTRTVNVVEATTPAPVTGSTTIKRAVRVKTVAATPAPSTTVSPANLLTLPANSTTPAASAVKGASTSNKNNSGNALEAAIYALGISLLAFIIYLLQRFWFQKPKIAEKPVKAGREIKRKNKSKK